MPGLCFELHKLPVRREPSRGWSPVANYLERVERLMENTTRVVLVLVQIAVAQSQKERKRLPKKGQ